MYRHVGFVATILASAIGTLISRRGFDGGLMNDLATALVTILALGTAAYLLLFLFIALTAAVMARVRPHSKTSGGRRASSRSE